MVSFLIGYPLAVKFLNGASHVDNYHYLMLQQLYLANIYQLITIELMNVPGSVGIICALDSLRFWIHSTNRIIRPSKPTLS